MRHAAGEVPQVALLEVVDEVAALVIDPRDADLAGQDVGPLGFFVPVELADGARVESHVDARQLDTGGQFADGGLTSPSPFLLKVNTNTYKENVTFNSEKSWKLTSIRIWESAKLQRMLGREP